jgi:hypothetical protein
MFFVLLEGEPHAKLHPSGRVRNQWLSVTTAVSHSRLIQRE